MKLVDILARKITEWPQGQPCLWISDAHSATIYGKSGSFEVSFNGDWRCPEDYLDAIVYKAEWQAAVDALKAGEVSYSAENVSAEVNYATHTDAPINPECKIVHPDWNGEGLPPVGTICDLKFDHWTDWERHEILCHGKTFMFVRELNSGLDREGSMSMDGIMFRQVRTPEQIAAEVRQKAINQICIDAGSPEMTPGQLRVASKLYDAGYRKFEIVDN